MLEDIISIISKTHGKTFSLTLKQYLSATILVIYVNIGKLI